jgi:excisionase family DNA binding protein
MTDQEAAPTRDWLTVEEAARVAGVSRQTVYSWIERGRLQLRAADEGKSIDAGDLERLKATRRAAWATGVHVDTLLRWIDEANSCEEV